MQIECAYCGKRVEGEPYQAGCLNFCNMGHCEQFDKENDKLMAEAEKIPECSKCKTILGNDKILMIDDENKPQAFCSDTCMDGFL